MIALHQNCLGCRAGKDGEKPSSVALGVLLVMTECSHEQIVRDLCFQHRRQYASALEKMAAAPTRRA